MIKCDSASGPNEIGPQDQMGSGRIGLSALFLILFSSLLTGLCIEIALLICFTQLTLIYWGVHACLLLPIGPILDTLFQTFISKLPMNKPVQGQRCVFCVFELILFCLPYRGDIRNGLDGLLIHQVVLLVLVRTQPLSCHSCLSEIPPHCTLAPH